MGTLGLDHWTWPVDRGDDSESLIWRDQDLLFGSASERKTRKTLKTEKKIPNSGARLEIISRKMSFEIFWKPNLTSEEPCSFTV